MTDHTKSPEALVDAYVQGTRTRDITLLKAIFHESAVMTGWFGPDFLHGGPEPFYGALEANDIGPDYTSNVVSVDKADRIATAQLDESNLLGLTFTNHFQMCQIADGSWRITAKLFRHS
ncbi:MAG: nuclear transport factor 2 family protein [Planctomycetota bacterium]